MLADFLGELLVRHLLAESESELLSFALERSELDAYPI